MTLRIWLAGSKAFGAAALETITALPRVQVVGVTAPPDDPLAQLATARGLPLCGAVVKPEDLRSHGTDLIVSAQNLAFIWPQARQVARFGAIGYHPSLLPRWRGRNAVAATIGAGDVIAGGTVYLMDDGWDTGPVIAQEACHVIPGWSAKDLWREALFPLGLRLLSQVIERQSFLWDLEPQDERVATTC